MIGSKFALDFWFFEARKDMERSLYSITRGLLPRLGVFFGTQTCLRVFLGGPWFRLGYSLDVEGSNIEKMLPLQYSNLEKTLSLVFS